MGAVPNPEPTGRKLAPVPKTRSDVVVNMEPWPDGWRVYGVAA